MATTHERIFRGDSYSLDVNRFTKERERRNDLKQLCDRVLKSALERFPINSLGIQGIYIKNAPVDQNEDTISIERKLYPHFRNTNEVRFDIYPYLGKKSKEDVPSIRRVSAFIFHLLPNNNENDQLEYAVNVVDQVTNEKGMIVYTGIPLEEYVNQTKAQSTLEQIGNALGPSI